MTVVTCAIIEKDGKILIARRAAEQKLAGKWEFPSGKVEDGGKPWGRVLPPYFYQEVEPDPIVFPHVRVHFIPKYEGDAEDPRGGVRWVFTEKAKHW